MTSYASNPTYRAWGAIKHLEYGSGYNEDITYNNKLQAASYVVDNAGDGYPAAMNKSYEYYNDGSLKLADESASYTVANRYDRLMQYDFAGRIKYAKSGIEAHGSTETNLTKLPYNQEYAYSALGNLSSKSSSLWNTGGFGFSYTYTNNRAPYVTYDNDGRVTADGMTFTYDGSGAMVTTTRDLRYETNLYHDGAGREIKRSTRNYEEAEEEEEEGSWQSWQTSYLIYSSILGTNISETTSTGKKLRTYVIAAGATIARQRIYEGTTTQVVGWEHHDPSGLSSRSSGTGGELFEELDPSGTNVGGGAPITLQVYNKSLPGDSSPFTGGDAGDYEAGGILMPGSTLTPFNTVPGDERGTGQCKTVQDMIDNPAACMLQSTAQQIRHNYGRWKGPRDRDETAWTWVEGSGGNVNLGLPGRGPGGPSDSETGATYETDCLWFARIVDQFVRDAKNTQDFMDLMAREFIGIKAASLKELQSYTGRGLTIGDEGFKAHLRDGTNLQVRHFTGGYIAGYLVGGPEAQVAMNSRENGPFGRGFFATAGGLLSAIVPATDEDAADTALNSIATRLGGSAHPAGEYYQELGGTRGWGKKIPARPGYKSLGDDIRREICD